MNLRFVHVWKGLCIQIPGLSVLSNVQLKARDDGSIRPVGLYAGMWILCPRRHVFNA